MAIERLDDAGEDMSPEEFARRFSDMADWIVGMITFDMVMVRYYREHHGINTFLRSKLMDEMGPLPVQVYYDGIHEIDDDEALIIETELPKVVPLLADARGRRSLLDDRLGQPAVEPQRLAGARRQRRRAARRHLAARDPGVPNWLDKANVPWGVIQMRWNKASDHPGSDDPEGGVLRGAQVPAHGHARRDAGAAPEQLRARREGRADAQPLVTAYGVR